MIKLKQLLTQSNNIDLSRVKPGDFLLLNNNKRVKIQRITKINGVPFLVFAPQLIVKVKTGNKYGINMINQNTGSFGVYNDVPQFRVSKVLT